MRERRGRSARRWVGVVVLLGTIALGGTLLLQAGGRSYLPGAAPRAAIEVDAGALAQALAEYIRIDTTNPPGPAALPDPPHVRFLVDRYARPLGLAHETLAGNVLAIRVPSPRPEPEARRPLVLLSHADVVPVDAPGTWTHPPLSGAIADGFVFGRGALDDKGSTIAALEAVRALRKAGLAPARDVVVLVGADEETGGTLGIAKVAAAPPPWLRDPWLVLDEGSAIIPDLIPGTLVAAIAVAEKGFATAHLRVRARGGHASMPTGEGAPDVLARALARLSRWREPGRFLPPIEAMLDRMGDARGGLARIVLKNRWLFSPLIRRTLDRTPGAAAMLRSTAAITILEAGVKDNVIPEEARAVVNLRLLPGERREAFLDRLRAAIADPRVEIAAEGAEAGGPIADYRSEPFRALEAILHGRLAGGGAPVLVVPIVTPGTTDVRHFAARGVPALRHLPFVLAADDLARLHGRDERVAIADLERAVGVYADLMIYPPDAGHPSNRGGS